MSRERFNDTANDTTPRRPPPRKEHPMTTEISEKALEEIKTKVSAASWDHADDMQKSLLANEIWWLAHNALEAAARVRAEANAEGGDRMPERIRVWENEPNGELVASFPGDPYIDENVEYVRADLAHPAPQPSGTVEALANALCLMVDAFLSRHGCFPLDQTTKEECLWYRAMKAAYGLVGQPRTEERERKLSALTASKPEQAVPSGWQPIETAPHNRNVLLGWRDWRDGNWCMEVGAASWGTRTGAISNMSAHGSATHWMPLPAAPTAGGGDD